MSTLVIPNFLNVNEVADELGCTPGRVRQMLLAGEISGVKANARAWLIPYSEVTKAKKITPQTGRPRKSQKRD